MAYLVDTNVISELCRRDPDQGVLTWADGIKQLAASVITVEEVFSDCAGVRFNEC